MWPVCAPASLAISSRGGRLNARRMVRMRRVFQHRLSPFHGAPIRPPAWRRTRRRSTARGRCPSSHGQLDQIVVERARDQRLEPAAHEQVRLEALAAGLHGEAQRMLGPGRHDVVDVGAEDEASARARCPCTSISTARNGASATSTSTFSDRRHEVVLAVGVLAQHAGEQLDQRHAADRACRRRSTPRRRGSSCRCRRSRAGSTSRPAPGPWPPCACSSASSPAMRLVLASVGHRLAPGSASAGGTLSMSSGVRATFIIMALKV